VPIRPAVSYCRLGQATRDRAKELLMSAENLPFKVADLSLAEFGRKEIRLAEH